MSSAQIDSRPDWDTYYISMCILIAQRSIDQNTKHGCIITDSENTILSIGYNGPPRGCDDANIPLERPYKYLYMEHAESNAIINAARNGVCLKNSNVYITGEPCHECIRKLINIGCKKIVYCTIQSKCNDDISSKLAKEAMLSKHPEIKIIKLGDVVLSNTIELFVKSTKYIDFKRKQQE